MQSIVSDAKDNYENEHVVLIETGVKNNSRKYADIRFGVVAKFKFKILSSNAVYKHGAVELVTENNILFRLYWIQLVQTLTKSLIS